MKILSSGVVEAMDISMVQLHGSGSSNKVRLLLKVLVKLAPVQTYELYHHTNMLKCSIHV